MSALTHIGVTTVPYASARALRSKVVHALDMVRAKRGHTRAVVTAAGLARIAKQLPAQMGAVAMASVIVANAAAVKAGSVMTAQLWIVHMAAMAMVCA